MMIGTVPETIAMKVEPAVPVKGVSFAHIKVKKSFLYIGDSSERTTKCLAFFDFSHAIKTYKEAKKSLINLYQSGSLPDFIIVDLPLNARDFSDFVLWLHSNKWSFMIPVMYNETILTSEQCAELRQLNIADDIVNIEEYCSQLSPKASLIIESKLKREQKRTDTAGLDYRMKRTPVGKRIFDIVIASLLLLLTAPLFLIIALIIKLESKGPVIYSSRRAGRGFKVFKFYKFRTMVVDADKIIEEYSQLNVYGKEAGSSNFFKLHNDPRVTRFGSFLRNTSMDELPQLINVLKGDMSIVGNRPLPLYEAATLTTDFSADRFSAPAGITGLWQVTKRGREEMDAEERISLDVDYARKQSFLMDCRILMMTPLALLQKSNV